MGIIKTLCYAFCKVFIFYLILTAVIVWMGIKFIQYLEKK